VSPQLGQRAPVNSFPRLTPQLAQDFASLIVPSSVYILMDKHFSSFLTEEINSDRIKTIYPHARQGGNKILELLKKY
jgi:hypothetical protein